VDAGARDRGTGIAATVAEAGTGAVLWAWHIGRPVRALTGTAVCTVAHTVLRCAPPDLLAALTARGRSGQAELERLVGGMLRLVVRHVVAAVLATTDLTELVRRHVDLDAVAAGLDVDAVAARVDVDAAVGRVDVDAAVGRVDLDRIVRRVDLDAVVRRIDLDAMARRIDIDALATRINPDPVVARVDLDAVLARLDLVGIAREVMDAVDLPEIVRHSTGTLTSDTIRTVRREAMQADEAVAGFLDRLLRRRQVQEASAPS
jgi:hypothetical protein